MLSGILKFQYCRMANFSASCICPFFLECFQTGINNTGKTTQEKTIRYMSRFKKYGEIIVLTEINNLRKRGKSEKEKKYMSSLRKNQEWKHPKMKNLESLFDSLILMPSFLMTLTHSYVRDPHDNVVWIYDTFDNNLGIKNYLTRYLKEICQQCFH